MSIVEKMNILGIKTKIVGGILIPLIFMLALGITSMISIKSIVDTNGAVDHTHEVLKQAGGIIGSAVDMETGMRGYLLAGQEGFLDPYKGGEQATYAGISAMKSTVSDNPRQVSRMEEVEKTLKAWQSNVTEPTIDLRRQVGDAKTMNDMASLVGEARGKVYFDKFRGQIKTFIDRESLRQVPGADQDLYRPGVYPARQATEGIRQRISQSGRIDRRPGHQRWVGNRPVDENATERGVDNPYLRGDHQGQRHPGRGSGYGDRHARLPAGRQRGVPGPL